MEHRSTPKPPQAILVTSPEDVKPLSCCDRRGGIDSDKLEAVRKRFGIEGDGGGWPEEFDDPAFSRRVLSLDDEQADRLCTSLSMHLTI